MSRRRRPKHDESFVSFGEDMKTCLMQVLGWIGIIIPLGFFLIALLDGWWSNKEDRIYFAVAAVAFLFIGLPFVLYVWWTDDSRGRRNGHNRR